jgi:hypothetical protein
MSDGPSRARLIAGDLALWAVVLRMRFRAWRGRRAKLGGAKRSEVIVAFPHRLWRGRRTQEVHAVIDRVVHQLRDYGVEVRGTKEQWQELRGIGRTYLSLTSDRATRAEIARAIEIAAWQHGLRRGRSGLLVVPAPPIAAAAAVVPPGQIVFTNAYKAARAAAGVNGRTADGVTILIVDTDRPDLARLPTGADVEVLDPSPTTPRSGHATVVTAIVADIAPKAAIKTISIGDEDGSGSWALLEALLADHGVDLVVASLYVPDAKSTKDRRARTAVVESMLRTRKLLPGGVPMFFPTGNHDPESGEKIHTIALPARFDTVIAIGAADVLLNRAAGSRYGEKMGKDPGCWWLAPGGSFGGAETVELVTMDRTAITGTSVANAFAAGVAAVVLSSLKQDRPPPDPEVDEAIESLKRLLARRPGNDESIELAETIKQRHAGQRVSFNDLVAELERLSDTSRCPNHNELEYGHGLIAI